jgi:hypothetical protein
VISYYIIPYGKFSPKNDGHLARRRIMERAQINGLNLMYVGKIIIPNPTEN